MRTTILIAALLALAVAGSCSDESSDESTNRTHTDAAGFDSPESLIDEIKSVVDGSATDLDRFYELCYAENELQEVLILSDRNLKVPLAMLNQTCLDRFGEKLLETPVLRWPTESMALISNDGARALVECSDQTRDKRQMHLVRIGGSWRISGYTWEYSNDSPNEELIAGMERLAGRSARVQDEIRRRIDAGEFASFRDVQEAYALMLRDLAEDMRPGS